MDKVQFLKNFEEQFQETDLGTIQMDTKFRDLPEWSSLVALCVIAMVDESFSKTLTGDELASVGTVEELYTLVQNK